MTEKEKNDRDKESQRGTTGAETAVRKANKDSNLRQHISRMGTEFDGVD